MATKHNRTPRARRSWRDNTRSSHVDSRHFDSGFEFSGFQQHNTDGSSSHKGDGFVRWIVIGAMLAGVVVAVLKYVLEATL